MNMSLICNRKTTVSEFYLISPEPNTYLISQEYLVRHRIAEPLRPYENFQQLKVARIKQAEPTLSSKKEPLTEIKGTEGLQKTAPKQVTPSLILEGKWLNKAGFSADTRCLIEVYRGMLVITPDEPTQ